MRKVKKIAAALLLISIISPCFLMKAWAAEGTLQFTDPDAVQGKTVDVEGVVRGTGIKDVSITMTYDTKALEFVSGDNVTGGDGTITYQLAGDGTQNEIRFPIRFNVLTAGDTGITATASTATIASGEALNLTMGNSTVKAAAGDGSTSYEVPAAELAAKAEAEAQAAEEEKLKAEAEAKEEERAEIEAKARKETKEQIMAELKAQEEAEAPSGVLGMIQKSVENSFALVFSCVITMFIVLIAVIVILVLKLQKTLRILNVRKGNFQAEAPLAETDESSDAKEHFAAPISEPKDVDAETYEYNEDDDDDFLQELNEKYYADEAVIPTIDENEDDSFGDVEVIMPVEEAEVHTVKDGEYSIDFSNF